MYFFNRELIDRNGKTITRTPEKYPYSYERHVIYRNGSNNDIEDSFYSDRLLSWDRSKHDKLSLEIFGNTH